MRLLHLHVFVGVCFEGFLASWSAEVKRLSHVSCLPFRSLLIYFHATNWVFSHYFTSSQLDTRVVFLLFAGDWR